MLFYFIIFFFLFLISLFDLEYKPRAGGGKMLLFISIILFFILLGSLRWNTGNDWKPYKLFFELYDWDTSYSKYGMEPLYGQLNRIIVAFGGNFTAFLFLYSILMIGLRAFFLFRYVNCILLACLLYYGNNLFDFAATRQWLAITVALLGVIFIVKRKFIPFVLVTLVSISIHTSMILFLPAYYIYRFKWSNTWQVIALVGCMVLGFTNIFGSIATEIFGSLAQDSSSRITSKADIYLQRNAEIESGRKSIFDMALGISKRAVIIPILWYFRSIVKFKSPVYEGFLNLFIFGNCIYFLLGNMGMGISRLATVYYSFEIILLCLIVDHAKSRKFWYFVFVLYALVKLVFVLTSLVDIVVPYYSIFDTEYSREGYNFE